MAHGQHPFAPQLPGPFHGAVRSGLAPSAGSLGRRAPCTLPDPGYSCMCCRGV